MVVSNSVLQRSYLFGASSAQIRGADTKKEVAATRAGLLVVRWHPHGDAHGGFQRSMPAGNIGVKPDGDKVRVLLSDGYRESKDSRVGLLLDLKAHGLQAPPLLAVGDGAMGLWAALEEVFPRTRHQRCRFHKSWKRLQCNAQIAARHGQGNAR